MVIAVPTGIKIFSWIATMWGGARSSLKNAMLWAVGFHLPVHGGRCDRRCSRQCRRRYGHARYLLRGRAFPLRAVVGCRVHDLRRHLLLDRQNVRPACIPKRSGKLHFWVNLHRCQHLPSSRSISSGWPGMPRRYIGLSGRICGLELCFVDRRPTSPSPVVVVLPLLMYKVTFGPQGGKCRETIHGARVSLTTLGMDGAVTAAVPYLQ